MVDPCPSRRGFLKASTTIVAGAAVAQHSSPQAAVGGGDKILNFHPKMGYRKLGKTGHMISEISLGGHGGSSVEDRVAVLNKAVELGINYVDNNIDAECDLYGAAMARCKSASRDRWFIGFASWPEKVTEEYEKELEKWQGRLNLASRDTRFRTTSVVVVFEGNDSAGKGGAIRRVTQALDARWYDNISVAAPTEEELAQPYLWRFWRHLPRHGCLTIFDRSWYGRVLVERIERFCADVDWMRAYSEINDFEGSMVRSGTVVVKFWLAISKDEQYRRFKERENVAFKRFKITNEDWRNRKKWDAYEVAVCDMVDRTSTAGAPWTLVEANNKYYARIKVLKTLCLTLEARLERIPKGTRTKEKK